MFCLAFWLCEAGMRGSTLLLLLAPPKRQCWGAFGLFVWLPSVHCRFHMPSNVVSAVGNSLPKGFSQFLPHPKIQVFVPMP